jgi:hypothetical protein
MTAIEPISDTELDEIERRCTAASKAPWQSFIEGRDHWGGDNFIRVGGLDDNEPDMYISRTTSAGLKPAAAEDLDFIAHARQDIPRLVAEIKRLRAEHERDRSA